MARLVITRKQSRFWSAHTHSRFSNNDALPSIKDMVAEAKRLGYRGLGLTDHGNMVGAVQMYKECMKAGIKPFIGSEFYLVKDRTDKKAKRYHLGLIAYTTQGYRNMVAISTRSHRQFYNKPLLDLADLADLKEKGQTEGVALMTGCFFGLVIQTLVSEGYDAAKAFVAYFKSCFEETYIEIQAHCIEQEPLSEEEICAHLANMADELGLPMVVTQDSHYVQQSDRPLHESLKRLVAFGPESDDAVFPGDGFHLAEESWIKAHHTPEGLSRGLSGLDRLIDLWDMHIPEMDEYNYRVPNVMADPMQELVNRCTNELVRRGLHKNSTYLDRLEEEVSVIDFARMGGYMMLVAIICDHMRETEMFYQVRGSGAGSLVSWLLGISNRDPIKWKLRFDRFLSRDRTKPPDIDVDVEHDRRQELIEWIGTRFAVIQLSTQSTYSIAGEEGNSKGSLRVRYISRQRMMGVSDPAWPAPPVAMHELNALSSLNLVSGFGVHPAGLILCNSRTELESQVPLMWIASSGTMVSQYNGNDAESIGLVKLDVLGVKTLSVLRRTLINMNLDPKKGLDWIPLTDRRVFRKITTGDTAGIFQLEGWTNAREVKRLKPTRIDDVIAAMALYRPGVMSSGAMDSFVRRKHGEEEIPIRHLIIQRATNDTFGILLYQDQVIEVIRALGMNADQVTEFLKAVKASNKNVAGAAETMHKYEPIVHQMCLDAGMDDDDIKWLWEALEAFAEYSFNRAHATVYGITAYQCAYLITNHALQFHAALLAVAASTDKERNYVSTTRGRGIRLMKADVNASRATYAVDPKGRGIRKGLMSIKGVGPKVAQEIEKNQPFKDLDDFVERVNPRIISGVNDYKATKSLKDEDMLGKFQLLYDAGAFDSMGVM